MTLAGALEVFRETPLSGGAPEVRGLLRPRRARERIECPWSAKGRVMRGLAERFGGDPDAILAEGVLLGVDGGWVLMLPDPDSPVFYVYAESGEADGSPARDHGRVRRPREVPDQKIRRCSQAKIALEVQGGLYSCHGRFGAHGGFDWEEAEDITVAL